MNITIPHDYKPREYQKNFYNALSKGFKRIYEVAHRRWGKDKTCVNICAKEAFKRKGLYLYLYPEYNQARKAVWDGMDKDGFRFMDHFPQEVRSKTNNQEMKITLKNGSIFQLAGSDNFDSFRSTNPVGIVLSEYAYQNPQAWRVLQPVLLENDGWAAFITTFNGDNHAAKLAEFAKGNEKWFFELSSVEETGAISIEQIEDHRKELIAEGMSTDEANAFIQQEYYCSLNAFVLGAYYTEQLNAAEKEGRITGVPREANVAVDLFLDLGKNDSTSIGFVQSVGREIRIIDHLSANGKEIEWYCKELDARGYRYGTMYLPHDATHSRLESPKTIQQQFEAAGFKTQIVPNHEIINGIYAVRQIFPKLWIDKEKCSDLLNSLRNYHKEYDERAKVFKNSPKHDWSSHDADMVRYLAIGYKPQTQQDTKPIPTEVDILEERMNRVWGGKIPQSV